MKEIKITSNGIKQAIDDLVDENERLQDKVYKLEDIIKEVRENLDKQIDFCTNEANGTTNDKYCRIAIQYLKHLKQKLDKEVN